MDHDERLMAGVAALAHLQSAALEVIAALRATLDVAEELVRDPSFASRVVEFVDPSRHQRPPAPPDDGPVQHIRIS